MTNRIRNAAVLTLAGLTVASLVGCQGSSVWSRHGRIRNNLTPELATLDMTHVDTQNRYALMANENSRMLKEDLERVFLLERPSRLTSYPMPH